MHYFIQADKLLWHDSVQCLVNLKLLSNQCPQYSCLELHIELAAAAARFSYNFLNRSVDVAKIFDEGMRTSIPRVMTQRLSWPMEY